jgi:ppGpp synthetase/RelA/SpoT-type nucleotidyltranferase
MNTSLKLQAEMLERFNTEKPTYEKLGKFVVDYVTNSIVSLGEDPNIFFEITPSYRIKDEGSLVQKALYREKGYRNPYEDITDKVGVRFVVLFTDRMKIVNDIVESIPGFVYSKDRDFHEEQKASPLVFSYQSDHYIVHPEDSIEFEEICIPKDFCCEIQVRSLLQHAYAQITHDIFYKPAIINDNKEIERQVARCMAMMEITDEKFNEFINYNKQMETEMSSMLKCLQTQYSERLGRKARVDLRFDKTMLWDLDRESTISEESIIKFYDSTEGENAIKILLHYLQGPQLELYRHVAAMFVVYLLMNGPCEKKRLINNWGFDRQILEDVFADFGISYEGFQKS